MTRDNLTSADLFSGAGGLTAGMDEAGMETVVSADFDPMCVCSLCENGYNGIEIDIREKTVSNVVNELNLDQVDLIGGGPPCQGFSKSNHNRSRDDERNALLFKFVEIVGEAKPEFFIMENVPGLLDWGDVIERIYNSFRSFGYRTKIAVLNSFNYEVPQKRKRVFTIGSLSGEVKFPGRSEKHMTVSDGIKHISEDDELHEPIDHSKRMVRRIEETGHGESLYDSFKQNIRLHPDEPSPTIMASGRKYAHPTENRFITTRERMRLQTFPDDYFLCGTQRDLDRQVGNAVPVRMAEKVVESLVKRDGISYPDGIVKGIETEDVLSF